MYDALRQSWDKADKEDRMECLELSRHLQATLAICEHALFIIPTGHTRITNSSATTIDLVLSSSPELTKSCETVPPIGTSDHNGILFSTSMQTCQAEPFL